MNFLRNLKKFLLKHNQGQNNKIVINQSTPNFESYSCTTCSEGYREIIIDGKKLCFNHHGMNTIDKSASICYSQGDKLPLPTNHNQNRMLFNFWKAGYHNF